MSTRKIQSVLCVDDDPDICEVIKTTLSLIADLNVHTAESGEQAIDLAYQLRPDLVLLDAKMPVLDGPSTLRRMRQHALLADIPVIFLTAVILPAEVAHYLQLGALGVIRKPFAPLKLSDDVFALWKHADVARQLKGTRAAQSRVQAKVGGLTGSFLQRTRHDVIHLREIVELARQGDRSVLKEVERIAHSIHGAGAMFGFPNVSAAGAAIERLVRGVIAGTAVSNSTGEQDVLRQLVGFTHQLAQDVDAGEHAAPSSAGMFQG